MWTLVLVLSLSVAVSWAFIPILATERNFVPSAWTGLEGAASEGAERSAEFLRAAEPRSKYGAQPKRGYPAKTHYHKTEISIDPPKIVLKCKIQEPLEHVVWIRSRCPGGYDDHDVLVAEGTTVHDKSLFDVRLLGGNSTITSELQLKQPLEPESAGLFRCEAWPHGGGGGPYGQVAANDVYLIGGKDLLRHCFGGWDSSSHSESFEGYGKTGGKHRSSGEGQYKPKFSDLRGAGSSHLESTTEAATTTPKYQSRYPFGEGRPNYGNNRRYRPTEDPARQQEIPEEVSTTVRPVRARPSSVEAMYEPGNTRYQAAQSSDKNHNSRFQVAESEQNYQTRYESTPKPVNQDFESLVKEYNNYLLRQQAEKAELRNTETRYQATTVTPKLENYDTQNNNNYQNLRYQNSESKNYQSRVEVVTPEPTSQYSRHEQYYQTTPISTTIESTPFSSLPPRYYIVATTATPNTIQRASPVDHKPFVPSTQFPLYPMYRSAHQHLDEQEKSTEAPETTKAPESTTKSSLNAGPIWNVEELMRKYPYARVESRASRALYGWKHGNGTVHKMEESATTNAPAILVTGEIVVTPNTNKTIKSIDF